MGLRFALVGSLSYSVKPRGQRGTPENVFGVGERQGWPHHSVKIAQLLRFAILASQFSGHDRARKHHHDELLALWEMARGPRLPGPG